MDRTLTRTVLLLGSGAAAGGLGAFLWSRRQGDSLRGKVVLITGGSRGLGLALARGFARQGASLALCARSEDELDSARRDLSAVTPDVLTLPCDVSDRQQVDRLITAALDRYGRIDVLVNNAGRISVGPVDSMTVEDFEQAMAVMFWGTVYPTLAVLPHMRSRGEGRIVNITSIGGKVSVPHLVPYSCAKFAAVAFSEGLRAELSETGIKVVTIAPGLMRTGSYRNAVFKGDAAAESVWFSAGASIPAITIGAERAARQIIAAARRGQAERILSTPAKLLALAHGMFPGTVSEILGLVNRLLPHDGHQARRGSESAALEKPWLRAVTVLGRQAAERFLQPAAPGTVR